DAVVDQPQAQVAPSTPEVTPTPVPPTPTPVPNTDSLDAISGLQPVSLYPGESHVVGLTYLVTTPRTATAVHAELRLADGTLATGWLLAANTGTQSVAATGPAVDMSEDASVAPDSSFPLLLTITAPADIAVEHT